MSKPPCDCLNWCGDDPDLAKGKAVGCERRLQEQRELARAMRLGELLRKLGHAGDTLSAIEELNRNVAELARLKGEQAVMVRLLVACDGVLSTLEPESDAEAAVLDQLRHGILGATLPHRPEEADLLGVRAGLASVKGEA